MNVRLVAEIGGGARVVYVVAGSGADRAEAADAEGAPVRLFPSVHVLRVRSIEGLGLDDGGGYLVHGLEAGITRWVPDARVVHADFTVADEG